MSAAVILALSAARAPVHASGDGTDAGSIGLIILGVIQILVVLGGVVWFAVILPERDRREAEEAKAASAKRFRSSFLDLDGSHADSFSTRPRPRWPDRVDIARLSGAFDKIEYSYRGEWYKVGTGPLPMADWSDTHCSAFMGGNVSPLNWRYEADKSAVYDPYPEPL